MNRVLSQNNLMSDIIDRIPGGIGIYNLYPDNRIKMVYLNDEYFSIMETTREKVNSYLDYSINEVIHPDDIGTVISELFRAVKNNAVANSDFRVMTDIGEYKWVNWNCRIAHKTNEKTVLYAVFNNVDKAKKASLQIEASKRILSLANGEGKVTIWLYDIKRRQIITDLFSESTSDSTEIIKNVPESIIFSGGVMEQDRHAFANAFNKAYLGEERSECIVRMLNPKTNKFEWRRLLIVRIHDNYYDRPMAFVMSADIDNEYKTRLCYERELGLRKELLKDAIIYYQINLTTGFFEEYVCKTAKFVSIGKATQTSDKIRNEILQGIAEEDHELVLNTIFSEALAAAYKDGIRTRECVYRRFMEGGGRHWVKANVSMTKKPDTEEIVAFIYVKDIDERVKDRLAISSIVNEEIETACIIDVDSGKARLIRENNRLYLHKKGESFNYWESINSIIMKNVIQEDQKLCLNFFEIESLVFSLQKKDSTTLTFRSIDSEGLIKRKKTLAFFLDDTHKDIVMSIQDITRLYEENQAKSDFLSRLNNDMRAPLNSLISLAELAKEEKNWQKVREYLDEIYNAGSLLLNFVNENLELSSIENDKTELNDSKEPIVKDIF